MLCIKHILTCERAKNMGLFTHNVFFIGGYYLLFREENPSFSGVFYEFFLQLYLGLDFEVIFGSERLRLQTNNRYK